MENILELDTLLAPGGVLERDNVQTVMARDSMIVSWFFTTIENASEKDCEKSSVRGRSFELLALLAQSIDVYNVLPNWSTLPSTSNFKNESELDSKKRINGIRRRRNDT